MKQQILIVLFNIMDIKITSMSLLFLSISFVIIYIYICEKSRIWKLIQFYNSPIEKVNITFTKTYLVDKKILYIRLFSSNYTIIHEIAHSICPDIGHTDNFYNTFTNLLSFKVC